jgi:hypothetical protein
METFESAIKEEPAAQGENTAGGVGLSGVSEKGRGVEGRSTDGVGVVGISENYRGVQGHSTNEHGVFGTSDKGYGVAGISETRGVHGRSTKGHGVWGTSTDGIGVVGRSDNDRGIYGKSTDKEGVFGESDKGRGVLGRSQDGRGVQGNSTNEHGVFGESVKGYGVAGISETRGVHGRSTEGHGVWGTSTNGIGVVGRSDNHIGVYGKSDQGEAGRFDGDVRITGKLTVDVDIILSNADCAEDFDVAAVDTVEPGTVMVVGEDGLLHQSQQAYDKRVAGVVSGAGDYKPGIILDKQESLPNRKPIALLGKVYCKVDASHGPVEVGDLLTTSPTSGHAMKASDPFKAFGAVIGKALRPIEAGQGLIPILIALQ